MKYIYHFLTALIPGILFPIATLVVGKGYNIVGIIIYILAYMSLDFYSYIDKKLNYPNNIFINKH